MKYDAIIVGSGRDVWEIEIPCESLETLFANSLKELEEVGECCPETHRQDS